MTVLPYGEWPSPIQAARVATQSGLVAGATFVAGEPWWLELRPAEGGRSAVCRQSPLGDAEALLPAPWNVRTRVHEYGGGAWTVVDGVLVFAEYADQRLYRCVPGEEPTALTPEPEVPAGLRYADLTPTPDGRAVLCVRETHDADHRVRRDICSVPLDGSAATDPSRVRSIVAGSHFLAAPRLSPDGSRLAWLAWDHPQMPWDGTELRLARLTADGGGEGMTTLLGSTTESVLQPEWTGPDELTLISDRTGWWNLYRLDLESGELTPLCPREEDIGGPLWLLGNRWFAPLDDGRLLFVRTFGVDRLSVLDPTTGTVADVPVGDLESIRLGGVDGDRVLVVGGGSAAPAGLRLADLGTGAVVDLRTTGDNLPDPAYWTPAQARVFTGPGGRDVHAFVYPPRHPDAVAPEGERPPYVVRVHGGPTAHALPRLDPAILYWTSRGIGIVDVNYGGSSGYGRAYRERLREQWGVVDVEDVVAVAAGLAESGEADGARLGIEGGSAGGWTVLSALTTTKAFACGVSHFGVAELLDFAATTHDFESRYLDGLVGSLPEHRDRYVSRAPVNNVDGLHCPVLLLQGLDDPIVPPAQAEAFRDAMVGKGIPHAYLAYEGESHGFRRAETIVSALESSLSFYGQVMGFDPPGVPRLPLA